MIKIRNANKLPVMDLRQIAKFFAIIKNYEKMLVIEKKAKGNATLFGIEEQSDITTTMSK